MNLEKRVALSEDDLGSIVFKLPSKTKTNNKLYRLLESHGGVLETTIPELAKAMGCTYQNMRVLLRKHQNAGWIEFRHISGSTYRITSLLDVVRRRYEKLTSEN